MLYIKNNFDYSRYFRIFVEIEKIMDIKTTPKGTFEYKKLTVATDFNCQYCGKSKKSKNIITWTYNV
jgi:hypothetical protein